MVLTTKVRKRIFQVFFVFLFLSIQSIIREAIKIGYTVMSDHPERYFMFRKYDWEPSILFKANLGFFILHIVMQIPAGMYAQKYGAKIIMQLSMLFCASIALITPVAIILGGPYSLIVFVTLQGLGQGCFIPTFYVFTSQWVPSHYRSLIFSAAFGGLHFGTAIGIPIVGSVCYSSLGWWSGYVVSSLIAFVWVICSLYMMETWVLRERISTNTRDEFDSLFNIIDISEKGVTVKVPWKQILTSIPFWSTMIGHFGTVWIWGVFLADNSFFNHHHHMEYSLKDSASLNLISFLMIFIYGLMLNISDRFHPNKINKRRVMSSISLWGGSILLFILSVFDLTYSAARIIYVVGAALSSAVYCGVFLNHAELSPFFAGTLMGISNVVGNSANIFRATVQNFIVTNPGSHNQWKLNFLASSTVTFFSNLPFILYGSSQEQFWSPKSRFLYYEEKEEEEGEDEEPQQIQTRGARATLYDDKPHSPISKSKSSKKRLKMKKAKKRSNSQMHQPKKKSRLILKRWKKQFQ